MAKEIEFTDTSGMTDYVVIINSLGQWYNTAGAVFEAYNSANFTDYDFAATEFGTSGIYTADMPAIAAGTYNVVARRRSGGSPAQSDLSIGSGQVGWNGTNAVPLAVLASGVTHGGTDTRLVLDDTSGIGVPLSIISSSAASGNAVQILAQAGAGIAIQISGSGTGSGMDISGGDYGMQIQGNESGVVCNGIADFGFLILGGTNGISVSNSIVSDIIGNLSGSVGSLAAQAQADVRTAVGLPSANLNTQLTGIQADLPQRVTKNVALNGFTFPMVLSIDHVTGATGKTVSAFRSLDGAAFAACANAVTEISNGFYKINLAATDTNANTFALLFTASGCDDQRVTLVTAPT